MIVLTDEEWDAQRAELVEAFALLLTDASGSSDEVYSELSTLIKQYPTSACTEALAQAIIDTIHSKPAAIDFVLGAVAPLLPEFEATQVDWAGSQATWSYLFKVDYLELLNTIIFELYLHHKPRTAVDPDNRTLTCALLSGAMVKHGFAMPSKIPALFAVTCIQTKKGGRAQVRVISVCLQLGVGGKGLADVMEKERECSVETVIESLERFREEGYVTYPRGIELLEDTIDNAEKGFPRVYTPGEIWEKLFPY